LNRGARQRISRGYAQAIREEVPSVREVTYTIHHLDLGGWISTVKEEGDVPRPLAVTGRPESEAAADIVEVIFIDLRTRERLRREGSLVKRRPLAEELNPSLCKTFAAEQLTAVDRGKAVSFKEQYIRRWLSQAAKKSANRRIATHLTKVQPN
jgi:hypothetical protein